MYKLSLEVTNACNLRCEYCYIGEKHQETMQDIVMEKAIDIAYLEALKQKDRTLLIYFIGGEPLIAYERIKKCVSYAEEKNEENRLVIKYSITTNGTLINEEIMEFFTEKYFDIKLSLDGNRMSHDLNRVNIEKSGSYDKIISKLPLLKKYEEKTKKKVFVANVVTANNCGFLCENMFHLMDLGFCFIETGFDDYSCWKENDLEIFIGQIEETYMKYRDARINGKPVYFSFIEKFMERYIFPKNCFFSCKAGLVSIYVTVDGSIYPCFRGGEEIYLGSVFDDLDVAKIRAFAKLENTKNEECKNCSCLPHCHTCSCIMGNYDVNKDFFIPKKISCLVEKKLYELAKKEFTEEELRLIRRNDKM